jgi:hypothetical protein
MQLDFQRNRQRVEQVCFLEGYDLNGFKVVTTCTFPNAKLDPRFFHIESQDISAAAKHLRKFELRRLAQVHTHPTDWVGHSEYDDERAYSQSQGAISIVLPNFGSKVVGLDQAGVLIRTQSEWLEIEPAERSHYVQLVPSRVDLRK